MKEVRAITAEIRKKHKDDDDKRSEVRGVGIVYDQYTEIFPGFRERIQAGAVEFEPVVKSYFNHDPNQVLSTTESNPALALRNTDEGLEYISPIPDTSYGRDLEVNLNNGNVKGSSFTFVVPAGGDRMFEDDDGVIHRDISRLVMREIGPVTDPAYVQTTAESNAKAFVAEARSAGKIEKPVVENTEFRADDVDRYIRHGRVMQELLK